MSVKPQISGIITEICKEAGDYIQAGEVIAKVKVIPDMVGCLKLIFLIMDGHCFEVI